MRTEYTRSGGILSCHNSSLSVSAETNFIAPVQELQAEVGRFLPHIQTLTMDASKPGCAAVLDGRSCAGIWTRTKSHYHDNLLEAMAGFRAIQFLQQILQPGVLLVQTDNTTVLVVEELVSAIFELVGQSSSASTSSAKFDQESMGPSPPRRQHPLVSHFVALGGNYPSSRSF